MHTWSSTQPIGRKSPGSFSPSPPPPAAVVKVGGAALDGGASAAALAEEVMELQKAGFRVALIHGGGPHLTALMGRLGLEPKFVDGLRVTDDDALEAALMAFMAVNVRLTTALSATGVKCAGLPGTAGGLITAEKLKPGGGLGESGADLGWVGRVTEVNPWPLEALWQAGAVPVIAPLAAGSYDGSRGAGSPPGGAIYNVNADMAAGALAGALEAENCLFLTDVEGLMSAEGRLVTYLTAGEAREWLSRPSVSGGMRPKLAAAAEAVARGARRAVIADGRQPGAIVNHLIHRSGRGTVIDGQAAG